MLALREAEAGADRQWLIGRLQQSVSDDTGERIKDRDGNKESLEGILKGISIPRTLADEKRGQFEIGEGGWKGDVALV